MPEQVTPWTQEDYQRVREIKEVLEVVVYGPLGPDTDDCANAWKLSLMLKVIERKLDIDLLKEISHP